MPRGFKRILIIIIYLALFFSLGWFFYSILRPTPTCFDKKQNQKEEKIDCGGPCQACVKEIAIQDLIVQEKSFVLGGLNKYDAVAKIYNPNSQYGSPEFSYKIALKDSSGNILAVKEGRGYILPSETKHIIEVNMETKTTPGGIEVEISNLKWEKFSEYEKPQLNVYRKQYNLISSGPGFSEVYGLVRNESNFDFRVVKINVILKDSSGKPVAVNKTEMNDVNADEERDFRLLWMYGFPGEVRNIEVEAGADIYNSENFLKKYLPSEKFQEYKR